MLGQCQLIPSRFERAPARPRPTKGCGRTVSTTPGRTVPSLMQNSKRRSHGVSHQRTPRRGRSWTWIAQFRPGRFTIHSRVHVSKQDAVALAFKAAKQTPWTGEDGRELETRTTCLLPSCEAGSFVDLPAGARPKEHSQTECKRRRFDRQKRLARAELVSLSVPCRFVSQIGGPCSGFNPTIPTPAQSELQPWITSQEVSEGTTSTSSHVSVLCRLYAALCAHVPALNSHMPPVCRSLRACPSLVCMYVCVPMVVADAHARPSSRAPSPAPSPPTDTPAQDELQGDRNSDVGGCHIRRIS
jgi:hypothetical protein